MERRPAIRTRAWTRLEYERLIDVAFFPPGESVELLGGQIIVAEPQGSAHFAAIRAVEEALRQGFGPGWDVRTQGPIALDEGSEPEPDVAVVRGSFRDYVTAHPSRPALIVEVSESSLALDRADKGSLYARAGVADYWIVNLIDRALEVRRDPIADEGAPFGWRYGSLAVWNRDAAVSPTAAPGASIRVADLLP